jgi:hypothetical protein
MHLKRSLNRSFMSKDNPPRRHGEKLGLGFNYGNYDNYGDFGNFLIVFFGVDSQLISVPSPGAQGVAQAHGEAGAAAHGDSGRRAFSLGGKHGVLIADHARGHIVQRNILDCVHSLHLRSLPRGFQQRRDNVLEAIAQVIIFINNSL